ncbi:DNA-3-methyladenine glycosylase [Candidatus Falkowbacteria bacterium]|nr:DNA-3-methyladenine glycosylase [Candidatus Falkowbacteria bacterium]
MLLPKIFYDQPTLKIAQDLLGCFLVRRLPDGKTAKYMIVETEAYDGPLDKGSHASRGRTPRNQPMFETGGIAYVYFTYGMHYMLNAVTGTKDYPAAVLIRALEPSTTSSGKTDGPAKLTKTLEVDKSFNELPLYTKKHGLWIEGRAKNFILKPEDIVARPRIGINYAEEYKDKPWRFYIKNSTFISNK